MAARCVGEVGDLVAAACAVGDEPFVVAEFADGGEEFEFGDAAGDLRVFRLVAERAGHPAAAGGDGLDLEVGDRAEDVQRRAVRAERLLVAVAVDADAPDGKGSEVEPVERRRFDEPFGQQPGPVRDRRGLGPGVQRGQFVAQREQA